jgi:hypothetical protein
MTAMDQMIALLRDPGAIMRVAERDWPAIFSVARAEALMGTLAFRLAEQSLPVPVAHTLADTRAAADVARQQAYWEAEMCVRALAPLGIVPILLKGTAYAAAGLSLSNGRQIGDLDILVPRERLADVEAALLDAGWEWLKSDAYDDAYYRQHMHELPPMAHQERDRMIDVHHTILPLTHRIRPDAQALIGDAVPLPGGMAILSPNDRICHCAAHMLADGDLAGGLRNLWDLHNLLADVTDWDALAARAQHHGLLAYVQRGARLSSTIYGTKIPKLWDGWDRQDIWYEKRLLARDDWGCETRPLMRLIFYIRSHWLRMPPLLLLRHLWTKWRKGKKAV